MNHTVLLPDPFHALNLKTIGPRDRFCMPLEDSSHLYGGFWTDPLAQSMPITMFQLSLFFIVSRSLFFIFRPLLIPKVVCDVAAGIIMGPSGLGRVEYFAVRFQTAKHIHLMNTLATIGMNYVVFVLAVKWDTTLYTTMGKNTRWIGIWCFFLPLAVLICIATGLQSMLPRELSHGVPFMIFAFTSSSCPFVNMIHMLKENNLLSTELGQLALHVSLLHDTGLWCLPTLLIFTGTKNIFQGISSFILLALLVCFMVFVVRPWMIGIIHKTPEGEPVKSPYIVTILIIVLIGATVSDFLGRGSLFGSFIVGVVTPNGPPLGSALTQRIDSLVKTCILPFVFLSIGAIADLTSTFDWKVVLMFQGVLLSIYSAKMLGAMLPALHSGMSLRHAFVVALMLNTKGFMDLLVYRDLFMMKLAGVSLVTQLVCSATIGTAVVVPLSRMLYRASWNSDYESLRGHGMTIQSNLLASEMRILSCIHNENDVPGLVDLLEASNPKKSSPICLYMVHLMELVGRNAPSLMENHKHDAKCKHNGCLRIMAAFRNYLASSEGEASLLPFAMVDMHRNMHEGICRLAREKKVPLIIVPFLFRDRPDVEVSAYLSKLNCRIQAYAQCTVGVLVQRNTGIFRVRENFSYHVAVIFIGGPDDREALALAARMSGHGGVTITLFRVFIRNDGCGNRREGLLDRTAIDDLRIKNFGNERVLYREIRVEDWDHIFKAVQTLGDCYNLIMVGRRQHRSGIEEDELAIWMENPELGLIGDTLVSSDCCGKTASVLVLQHYNKNVDSSIVGKSSSQVSSCG